MTFDGFEQVPAACAYEWVYTVSVREVQSRADRIDFAKLIRDNPKLEGTDEFKLLDLRSLKDRIVNVKTEDPQY